MVTDPKIISFYLSINMISFTLLFDWFGGTTTIVGYLMPNPFLYI